MERSRLSQVICRPKPTKMRTAVASFVGLRSGNRAISVMLPTVAALGPRRRAADAHRSRSSSASSASSVPVFLASEPAGPVSTRGGGTVTSTLMFVGEHLRVADGFVSLPARREYFLSLGLDYDRSRKYFLVVEGLERRLREEADSYAPTPTPHALDAFVGLWEIVSSFFETLVAFSRFAVYAVAFCVSAVLDRSH